MIKRTGLTEEQSANSFSDEDLVGMVCGNNPQANAYRELLASRQSLLDCKQRIQQLLAERNSTGLAIDKAILSGIVPERHPLRSRLKLLANHHKREQALAELLRHRTGADLVAGWRSAPLPQRAVPIRYQRSELVR